MKKTLISLVVWVTSLCNIGLIVSGFYGFLSNGKELAWIHDILLEGPLRQRVLVIVMAIGIIVSFAAMSEFRSSKSMTPSVVMLVEAIVGLFCCSTLKNMFVEQLRGLCEITEAFGGTLMRVCYILLIMAAVLALGIDIYIANNGNNTSSRGMANNIDDNTCPRCGKTISAGEKFCDGCGFSMASLTCPNCGARRNSTSVYCKECGERLPVLKMRQD